MRHFAMAAAAAALLAFTTPVWAAGGSVGSMQRALFVAQNVGVVSLTQVQYYDGKWEIEGRDPVGRDLNVDIDALTGAIIRIDR